MANKIYPSDLPKDGRFSGRINKQIKRRLNEKGVTIQKIVDAYIDTMLKVDVDVKWVTEGKKK